MSKTPDRRSYLVVDVRREAGELYEPACGVGTRT